MPRIIPALAGNTSSPEKRARPTADHPRAGGEHPPPPAFARRNGGSSPRWRGTPHVDLGKGLDHRIIPALAGNTSSPNLSLGYQPDHPRAGGEHPLVSWLLLAISGSSPRWRGTHRRPYKCRARRRIIPALAGNTHRTRCPVRRTSDHPRAGGEHTVTRALHRIYAGSSPRWRGTPPLESLAVDLRRIIPALAGNTSMETLFRSDFPDHPRAGGEHFCATASCPPVIGSSPRWRGTQSAARKIPLPARIIPALAGNTSGSPPRPPPSPDHPRAGGEHPRTEVSSIPGSGSSPRWRGTLAPDLRACRSQRIIPALAGNTLAPASFESVRSDHPRAGGEHCPRHDRSWTDVGSSPRWRGTRQPERAGGPHGRIIPALAGNTSVAQIRGTYQSDHPRAGGEHGFLDLIWPVCCGSSPRWRGTRVPRPYLACVLRIIPALAGNTSAAISARLAIPDHPRAGGEHCCPGSKLSTRSGSSPRWRGTPAHVENRRHQIRIIPALAGNTRCSVRKRSRGPDHPRAGGEHDPRPSSFRVTIGSSPRWRGTRGP